ncbi:MAG: hypothetical protein KIT43_02890 [Bauldia sp.]|nr:hypothetical protein [Bauldia sp.]
MPVLRLDRFSDPETIRRLDQRLLTEFLAPHREYLLRKSIDLDAPLLEHERLVELLMNPGPDVPDVLVDALVHVHDCFADEIAEDMMSEPEVAALGIGPDATALDVALRVWMFRPEILRARLAETIARRQQSFLYYGGAAAERPRTGPNTSDAVLQRVQNELGQWFEKNHFGAGCKVFAFPSGEQTWFVVRHGQRKVREPSQGDDGTPSTELFRPQKYDVLLYDRREDWLAVHSGSKRKIALYLKAVGRGIFGDASYFTRGDIFTLAPLVDDGSASMNCQDIPGLERIRLVEVHRSWGGVHQEVEIRKANDIFASLAARNATLEYGKLTSAVMRVQFTASERERSVTIRLPSSARYERNDDSELIGRWLARRGFVKRRPGDEAAEPTRAVA